MPNFTYNSFKEDLFEGAIDLENDTIMVALVTSSYTASQGHTGFVADVQASEVVASGYTANGIALSGKSVSPSSNTAVFDADPVTWNPSTITASGAVIYQSGAGNLIAFIDFGANQSSSNGQFTINWAGEGIFRIQDV